MRVSGRICLSAVFDERPARSDLSSATIIGPLVK